MVFPLKIPLQRRQLKDLVQLAEEGDLVALEYFRKVYRCKVYTLEEINILNNYLWNGKKVGEIVNIRNEGRVVELPDIEGVPHAAVINWIEDLGDGYFRSGLSYICGYPYDDGHAVWVLKLDEQEGFKPLFDCGCWEDILRSIKGEEKEKEK